MACTERTMSTKKNLSPNGKNRYKWTHISVCQRVAWEFGQEMGCRLKQIVRRGLPERTVCQQSLWGGHESGLASNGRPFHKNGPAYAKALRQTQAQ